MIASRNLLFLLLLGVLFATPALAWERPGHARSWGLDGSSPTFQALEFSVEAELTPSLEPHQAYEPRSGRQTVLALAQKLSTLGAIILTADQVARSVDSVMNRLTLEREDGTVLKFRMEPAIDGFAVRVALSRPLDF